MGSGISALAKNEEGQSPKTWSVFMSEAMSLLDRASPRELEYVGRMIDKENYLLALEAIQNKCDPGKYRHYLQQSFSRPNYQPSKTHEKIKEIDFKVVITTNFDKVYDNLCNEHNYSISTYKESRKILGNIKSTSNLIIKAHGTIDDVANMVFTQQQYNDSRANYPEFYDLLRALFLTNTVLFLGYSLSDPDIQLVLETVANSSNQSCPHYIAIKEGIDHEIKEYWSNSFNISCLEYGPSYENLPENIENLCDEVLNYREVKRIP